MSKANKQQFLMVVIVALFGQQQLMAKPDGNITDKLYHEALEQIVSMLEGQKQESFKDAVFMVENAYLDGKLSYSFYDYRIQQLALLSSLVADQTRSTYSFDDSTNIKINYGVKSILMDSMPVYWEDMSLVLSPTSYDFDDFTGERDWTKMFVNKLLIEDKGNCHSLPYLYKILVEELGGSTFLALAPHHIYIKTPTKDSEMGWYNIELTNNTHPTDGWLVASGYITLDAIQNGLYMQPLDNKASLALCVLDLAQGYARKFPNMENDFVMNCLDIVLQYFPNCVNALLLKVEYLYKEQGIGKEVNALCQQLVDLGYDQMPKSMYWDWLTRTKEHKKEGINNASTSFDNPFMNSENTATLSKGRYEEFHNVEQQEMIGQLIFDTKANQVVGYKGEVLVEPTIISRFLSVDPLAPDYPSWSPYPFAMNRVIDGIDLDGLEWTDSKSSKGVGLNATYIVVNSTTIDNSVAMQYMQYSQKLYSKAMSYKGNGHQQSYFGNLTISGIVNSVDDVKDGQYYIELVPVLDDRLYKPKKGGSALGYAPIGGTYAIVGFSENDIGWKVINNVPVDNEGEVPVDKEQFGITVIHEILHNAGIFHPWISSKDRNAYQEQLAKDGITPDIATYNENVRAINDINKGIEKSKNIDKAKNNILNSDANVTKELRSTKGTHITYGQRNKVHHHIHNKLIPRKVYTEDQVIKPE